MLPDQSGTGVRRRLRSEDRTRGLPIIMLTARSEEGDRLSGFDAGVDDYICKPFSPRELLARIKALLRRAVARHQRRADRDRRPAARARDLSRQRQRSAAQARADGVQAAPLPDAQSRPVLSRTKVLDGVWGDHVFIEERTVDVHIRRLRLALQPSGHDRLIETVRGGGYRLLPSCRSTPPDDARPEPAFCPCRCPREPSPSWQPSRPGWPGRDRPAGGRCDLARRRLRCIRLADAARSTGARPLARGPGQARAARSLGRWLPIFERLARYVREAGSERVMASAEIDRLHAAVDLLPDALIVLDTRNDVQWLNRAATELLRAMSSTARSTTSSANRSSIGCWPPVTCARRFRCRWPDTRGGCSRCGWCRRPTVGGC